MPLQLAESNQAPPHPKQMGYQMRRSRDSSKPLEWTNAHAHTHTPDYCLATGGNNTLCSDSQTHIWIHPCRIQMHTCTRMLINGQTKSLHSQSQTCLLWDNRATNGKCNFFILIFIYDSYNDTIKVVWHSFRGSAVSSGFRRTKQNKKVSIHLL